MGNCCKGDKKAEEIAKPTGSADKPQNKEDDSTKKDKSNKI